MSMTRQMAARHRASNVPRVIAANETRLKALFQIGEMVEYDRRTATCTVEIPALEDGDIQLEPALLMQDVIYTAQHFSENAIVETLPSVRTYTQENTGEFVLTSSGRYERYDDDVHGLVAASSRYDKDKSGEMLLVTMFGGMSGPKYAIADIVPSDTTIRNLRNVVNAVASVDYGSADSLSTRAVIATAAADGIVDVVYNPVDTGSDGMVSTAEGYVSLTLHTRTGVEIKRLSISGTGVVTVLCSIELRDDDVRLTGDRLIWNGHEALITLEYSQADYDALEDKQSNIQYLITS